MVFGVTSPQGKGSGGSGGPAAPAAAPTLAVTWAHVSEPELKAPCLRRCARAEQSQDPETRCRSLHLSGDAKCL